MVFSSLTFLLLFLPATILLYAIARKIFPKSMMPANLILCLASLLFYRWGAGSEEFYLLITLVIVNYLALYIGEQIQSRVSIWLGLAFDCVVLLRFKYPALILSALQAAPVSGAGLNGAIIPLGMSFTIFHAISLLLDETYFITDMVKGRTGGAAPPRPPRDRWGGGSWF